MHVMFYKNVYNDTVPSKLVHKTRTSSRKFTFLNNLFKAYVDHFLTPSFCFKVHGLRRVDEVLKAQYNMSFVNKNIVISSLKLSMVNLEVD